MSSNEHKKALAEKLGRLRDEVRKNARCLDSEALSGIERAVILRLIDYINKNTEVAYPSIQTLADDAGCSRRTVDRALKKARGRYFDFERTAPGRQSVYQPIWEAVEATQAEPLGHDTVAQGHDSVSLPHDTVAQGHDTVAYDIENYADIDRESSSRECDQGGKIDSNPTTTAPEKPPVEMARQGGECAESAEPDPSPSRDPDELSFMDYAQADQAIKAARADLNSAQLGQSFINSRKAARAKGDHPGDISRGFQRYVQHAIRRHVHEFREQRRAQMIAELRGEATPDSLQRAELRAAAKGVRHGKVAV